MKLLKQNVAADESTQAPPPLTFKDEAVAQCLNQHYPLPCNYSIWSSDLILSHSFVALATESNPVRGLVRGLALQSCGEAMAAYLVPARDHRGEIRLPGKTEGEAAARLYNADVHFVDNILIA